MKACIINPPAQVKKEKFEEWSDNSIHNVQYLGIAYLESSLLAEGYEVTLYDCPSEGIDLSSLFEKLENSKYSVIGISVFYYNLFNFERILYFIEKRLPDTYVFIGGYAPTLDYQNMLRTHKFVKAIILGEGEKSTVELFQNLKSGNNQWKKTKGMAYLEDDIVKINYQTECISLDDLPFPLHQLRNKCQSISMLTSRGCYGNCSFCSEKSFSMYTKGTRIRYRSVKNVIEELDIVSLSLKPKSISFCDSNFMPATEDRKRWITEFLHKLLVNRYDIKFNALLRSNDVLFYEELLPMFKKAGFSYFFIGIESFIQRQLDFYEKNITVENNIKAIKVMIKSGISIEFGFLMLDPFTSISEIRENLLILDNLNIYNSIHYTQEFFSLGAVVFSVSGTKIYKEIHEKGIEESNAIGYHFINANVELYYERLKEWIRVLREYKYIKFLIDKCYYYDEKELAVILKKCIVEIYKLDVKFMLELLKVFIDENSTKELVYINKRKLEDIYNKYSRYIECVISIK